MIDKREIGKILLITITSFLVFLSILFKVDPKNAEPLEFIAFYVSIFLSLFGLFFLVGFMVMHLSKKSDSLTFYQSALHGGLLSLLLVGLIMLQHLGYFSFLNIIIFSLGVIFLEFTFSKR
ncbi:MAG: hypothetical protein AAB614_00180 [Patescibacteria group bacterium]